MSVFSLLDEVKESLRPDTEIIAVRNEVIGMIAHELARRDIKALPVPGGSVAKGTYLPLDHDVDVFVRFSLEYADLEEKLPDLLERALKQFAPTRLHGSRDYFQFVYQGYDFEVIPVLAVSDSSQARNVTDMSPIHVDYFRENGLGLEDEVRLTKQFSKAQGVYGAESYIRGFSGHVIDLLIMHYKSFYSLIKAAAAWKPPVVIDMERHHKDPLDVLNEAKLSPLILIDPVQPDRNAAAALSQEQFDAFVSSAKKFLQAPSEAFFVVEEFRKDLLLSRLSEHPGSAVWVDMELFDDKTDVAGARVRKSFERLVSQVRLSGFDIVEDGWHFDHTSACAWVCVAQEILEPSYEREGPPVSQETDAARFRDTHETVIEREGRLFARVERKERELLKVAQRVCEELSSEKIVLRPCLLSAASQQQQ